MQNIKAKWTIYYPISPNRILTSAYGLYKFSFVVRDNQGDKQVTFDGHMLGHLNMVLMRLGQGGVIMPIIECGVSFLIHTLIPVLV